MAEVGEKTEVLAVHPAAELFPLMQGEDLDNLAQSIKKNGLIEPVLTYEGKILDGRNRLAACKLAGVSPHYAEAPVNGGSPTLFVVALNLDRRHLTISQRAAVGADMMPMLREEAKKRQHEGQVHGGQAGGNGRPKSSFPANLPGSYSQPKSNDLRGESRSIAAKATGAGGKTIQSAAAVKERDPELFARIKRGEVSASSAYKKVMAEQPQPSGREQAAGPARAPMGKRQNMLAQAARKRMIDAVSRIRGMCRGIAELNVEIIATVLTKDEKKAFTAIGQETATIMRNFAHRLGAAE